MGSRVKIGVIFSNAQTVRVLRHASPPEPISIQAADIGAGRANYRAVRLTGVIYNASPDEIDPNWSWIFLISGGEKIAIAMNDVPRPPRSFSDYIGSTVELTGVCVPGNNGGRLFLGSRMEIPSLDAIRILDIVPKDPFDVDLFQPNKNSTRPTVERFDARKKTSGTVLAVWGAHSFLLKADQQLTIRVKLRDNIAPPLCGTQVTVSGFVSKNSFFVTFTDALFRESSADGAPDYPTVLHLAGSELYKKADGHPCIPVSYDGQTVNLVGTVRAHSNVSAAERRILLDANGYAVQIEMGSFPLPPIGSIVNITGICMMMTEQDAAGFDRVCAISLIPRSPDDIKVISTPSWWTPSRSLMTIGTLILLLIVIFIWCALLKKLAEHRGQALAKAQIAGATNALKVYERTRLAVELHDSLSQTLTGVSFEVNTANDLVGRDESRVRKHLDIATKALNACRVELRNCLWDLRSQALEETNMNEAIRLTLGYDIGDTQTKIRFNVPRQIFTDNTAHAILRIIRELVTNAIRHGHATHIRVAGAIEAGQVLFSVRDDGRGFNPANAPGPREGHFGLDGIRERIERIGGTLTLTSERGHGTSAVMTIPLPQAPQKEDSQHGEKDQDSCC